MIKNDLELVPVTSNFANVRRRSKYVRLIEQFLDMDEPELQVIGEDGYKMYSSLNANISRMDLRGKVGVRRRGSEVHLIRLG